MDSEPNCYFAQKHSSLLQDTLTLSPGSGQNVQLLSHPSFSQMFEGREGFPNTLAKCRNRVQQLPFLHKIPVRPRSPGERPLQASDLLPGPFSVAKKDDSRGSDAA